MHSKGLIFLILFGASQTAKNAKHFELKWLVGKRPEECLHSKGLIFLILFGASQTAKNAKHFELKWLEEKKENESGTCAGRHLTSTDHRDASRDEVVTTPTK